MKYYEFFLENKIFKSILKYNKIFKIFEAVEKYSDNFKDYLAIVNKISEFIHNFNLIISKKHRNEEIFKENLRKYIEGLFNLFPELSSYSIFEILEGFSLIYYSQFISNLEDEIKYIDAFRIIFDKSFNSKARLEIWKNYFIQLLEINTDSLLDFELLLNKNEDEYMLSVIFYVSSFNSQYFNIIIQYLNEVKCKKIDIKKIKIMEYHKFLGKKRKYIIANI